MPWQRDAINVGLEYEVDAGGLLVPAYREVIVTVMRQNGKSTLTFSVLAHRMAVWPRLPQRAIYTAQDGAAARGKLWADIHPLYDGSPVFKRLVSRAYRGVGPNEGINFRTGSTLRMIGSSEKAGHGATETGLAIIDESFADLDDRREQALSPGMATVRDAQTWNVSTAGTDASVFLRRKIELGRAAVEAGETSGLAYIEYSIPDDADCDDPETWWRYMPALGWTITPEVVAHERRMMTDNQWRRAFGNQWTSADERAIAAAVWAAACSVSVAPSGSLTWVLEVHPERDRACIVSCGGGVLELVDHRPGVGWLVDRITELLDKWGGVLRVDGGGPAAAMIPDLERAGVKFEELTAREVIRACQSFYDGLADRRFRIRSDPRLDAAAAAVTRRPVADAWVWSRRAPEVDVSPIMALSIAAPLPDAERKPRIHVRQLQEA